MSKASILYAICNDQSPNELRKTIASAKEGIGDYPHEIIVCDDQTTDGCTRDLPADVLILRMRKRQGCTGSRKVLEKAATGDVLIWSDPHCRYPEGGLKKMATAAENFAGIIQPLTHSLSRDSKTGYGGKWQVNERGIGVPKSTAGAHPTHPGLCGSVYVVKRSVFEKIGGWPHLPGFWGCADTTLGIVAWAAGIPVVVVEDVLCVHNYSPDRTFCFSTLSWHHAANAHWMHKACFPETYESVWRPLLLKHPKWNDPRTMRKVEQQLKSHRFREFASFVKSIRQPDRTESRFMAEVLNRKADAEPLPNKQTRKLWSTGPVVRKERSDALDFVAETRSGLAPERVLDIGAGDGVVMTLVRERFPGAKIEGVDLVPERVARCAEKGLPVIQGDAESLTFDADTFDLVTAFHVLEHCPNPEKAMSEIYRVLKPGGTAVVVVPREAKPKHRAHLSCFPREKVLKSLAEKCQLTPTAIRTALIHGRLREIRAVLTKAEGAVQKQPSVDYDDYVAQQVKIAPGDHEHKFVRWERVQAMNWLAEQGEVKIETVLDVGPRDGFIMATLQDKGAKVFGVEISAPAVEQARAKGLNVIQGDIMAGTPYKDASFDLVTCLHVLEHCPDPERAIKEMWRVVKPGGMLFVVVPRQRGVNGQRRGAHYSYFPTERSVADAIRKAAPGCEVKVATGIIKNQIREIRAAARKAVA